MGLIEISVEIRPPSVCPNDEPSPGAIHIFWWKYWTSCFETTEESVALILCSGWALTLLVQEWVSVIIHSKHEDCCFRDSCIYLPRVLPYGIWQPDYYTLVKCGKKFIMSGSIKKWTVCYTERKKKVLISAFQMIQASNQRMTGMNDLCIIWWLPWNLRMEGHEWNRCSNIPDDKLCSTCALTTVDQNHQCRQNPCAMRKRWDIWGRMRKRKGDRRVINWTFQIRGVERVLTGRGCAVICWKICRTVLVF